MKRIVTVAAALALTLSLAGCWGGDKGGCPIGGGGWRPSPLAILVSQWHFRVV